MKKNIQTLEWPTVEQLQQELRREKKRRGDRYFAKVLAAALTIALLGAVAVAFVWIPVLHINGDSMAPGLVDGEVVAVVKDEVAEPGDIIAFYYNNKLLVKRVIAVGGDEVNIDLMGNVQVNGVRLDEPYVSNRTQGDCDIEMPYCVPNGYVFVMGDNRLKSLDSRSAVIGCVAREQILGRVFVQLWPLKEIRWIQ